MYLALTGIQNTRKSMQMLSERRAYLNDRTGSSVPVVDARVKVVGVVVWRCAAPLMSELRSAQADVSCGSRRAIPAGSQPRQKPLNYRTQSLQHGRPLCGAKSRHAVSFALA